MKNVWVLAVWGTLSVMTEIFPWFWWALSNRQGAKRRGDLFHSSFHNRGMPASAPHSSSPSSSSSHPNYASPPSHPSYPPSGTPSAGYAPSLGQSSLTPTPMLTSSPSPTSHSHNSVGIYVTPYHSSHLKPELGMGDSANYAVPPPHPRPLHVSHEEAAHVRIRVMPKAPPLVPFRCSYWHCFNTNK